MMKANQKDINLAKAILAPYSNLSTEFNRFNAGRDGAIKSLLKKYKFKYWESCFVSSKYEQEYKARNLAHVKEIAEAQAYEDDKETNK